ncbi:YceI family protein [Aureibacter tunicatorum]|uniref:Lipid/polyisoprenoid-binding YceI-like domain-containing protein n=1 Tax=Aureibacter tunicatorum TaxID=866807 RepID=A0AAE4BRN6_9BACT|nr:YceI family protein [Aureibacter tunicatorum]MDR6238030.1 hypothetical protein [Aureibacter tunicatorum]BDD03063.1 hypothetical protein AUTU_05460 [Aureibacter tunicatorum]
MIVLLIHVLSFMIGGDYQKGKSPVSIYFKESSSINIEGRSNVNSFNFEYENALSDTFQIVKEPSGDLVFFDSILALKSESFDSGTKLMNRDFFKMIKSKEYPQIHLQLNRLIFVNGKGYLEVTISLAGEKNVYKLSLEDYIVKNNEFKVEGNLDLNINDFGLIPPKKAMGLIKVDNKVTVKIDLEGNYMSMK